MQLAINITDFFNQAPTADLTKEEIIDFLQAKLKNKGQIKGDLIQSHQNQAIHRPDRDEEHIEVILLLEINDSSLLATNYRLNKKFFEEDLFPNENKLNSEITLHLSLHYNGGLKIIDLQNDLFPIQNTLATLRKEYEKIKEEFKPITPTFRYL